MSSGARPTSRIAVFDGLRGVAIVLVMLSHAWLLDLPIGHREGPMAYRTVMENGNYAVSFFFVIGAFLYTKGLLARAAAPEGLHPGVQVMRRYVRLTVSVAVMLAILGIVAAVEKTPTYEGKTTGRSTVAVLTYTWNWYVKDNPVVARPDIGHLWYLSVDMQVFLLILLLVFLLRGNRAVLALTLGGLLVMVLLWRNHVYQTEGVYQALLRTNARMDAPLAGALAATALPWLTRLRPYAAPIAWTCVIALPVLATFTMKEEEFFQLPGALLDLSLAGFVVAASIAAVPVGLQVLLGNKVLAFLGRHSLSMYIWHFPVFMYLHFHALDWNWLVRVLVAVAIVVAVSVANDLVVERRVDQFLRSSAWHRLDKGVPAYLTALAAASRDRQAAAAHPVSLDEDPDASQQLRDAYRDEERSL